MHALLLLNPLQASLDDESMKAPRIGKEEVAILFHEPVESPVGLVVLGACKVEAEEEHNGVEAVAAGAAEPGRREAQGERKKMRLRNHSQRRR
jgi:hypothetical protein